MSGDPINLDEFFVPDDVEVMEPEDDLESVGDFDKIFSEVSEFEKANKPTQDPIPIQEYDPDAEPCVEDFIRQFLASKRMNGTIEMFERELYELQQRGEYDPRAKQALPSVYRENLNLQAQVTELNTKLEQMVTATNRARLHFDRFQKQRDFHRMHHRRVVQEKQKLISDLRRLKVHYEQFEPALQQLRTKYEGAMKEQLLAKLERERLTAKLTAVQKQLAESSSSPLGGGASSLLDDLMPSSATAAQRKRGGLSAAGGSILKSTQQAQGSKVLNSKGSLSGTSSLMPGSSSMSQSTARQTPWPVAAAANPLAREDMPAMAVGNLKVSKSFPVHRAAISKVAIHPKLPIVATASDDQTWSSWALPNGELLMSGEGHKEFVSALAFHPLGSVLATGGGDGVVRLWNLLDSKWHTLPDHAVSAVWDLGFHHSGDFFVSAAQDGTARVVDAHSLKVRQALRGHVDAINSVHFQPYSNTVLTASADKTISLWDMRSGLCVQTFYGHENAVNCARFTSQGSSFASCDADGVVKLFDVRSVAQLAHVQTGAHAANSVAFDKSGKVLAVASGDATIRIMDVPKLLQAAQGKPAVEGYGQQSSSFVTTLEGHGDAVNDVQFDPHNATSRFLVSGSSDGSFKIWQ